MAKICLVSCASSKLPHKAKAGDIYTSTLFQYAKAVAKRDYDQWYILSAMHGLLNPENVIEPYNKTLNGQDRTQRKDWARKVLQELLKKLKQGDSITFFAGDNYREYLVADLVASGYTCATPLEGLGLGQQIHTLKLMANYSQRIRDLERLYSLYRRLRDYQGSVTLSAMEGAKLSSRGLYFFFERKECRLLDRSELRCVRVGTHAVSRNSSSTLWTRLRTHRGTSQLLGNHRSSVFRLHVGAAMLARGEKTATLTSWGKGQDAPAEIRSRERSLEELVSRFIGEMEVLWIGVPDEPGPSSDRSYIEQNTIGLLSGPYGPFDLPSRSWLGLKSPTDAIRKSGLWNINFVKLDYDRRFLETLDTYVDATLGNIKYPESSIAPANWYTRNQGSQLTLI